jgi:hypothetical protein
MLALALLSCSDYPLPTLLKVADRQGQPGHAFHFVAQVDERAELTWVVSLAPESSSAFSEGDVVGTGSHLVFTPDVDGDFELLAEACMPRGCLQRRVVASAWSTIDASTPVAEAGDDQLLELGDTAVLDGGQSFHPSGLDLDYAWSFEAVPEVSALVDDDLSDRFTSFASFDGDAPGDFELRLIVDDGVTTASDTTLVSFSEPDWWDPNQPPLVDPGEGGMAAVGDVITLDASGTTDPEGDTIAFSWSFKRMPAESLLSDADIVDADQAVATFSPDAEGEYVVRVIAHDGNAAVSATTQWAVTGGNRPPVALAGSDMTSMWAQYVNLDGSESYDPDGDALSYRWGFVSQPEGSSLGNGDLVDRYTDHASFTPDASGDWELKLVAMDGTDQDVDTVVVSVSEELEDNPPIADCGLDQVVLLGKKVVLDGGNSFDPDGESLSYRWSLASLPSDSALDNSDIARRFTDRARFEPDVAGLYVAQLMVDDGSEMGSCSLEIEVVDEHNAAPVARTNGNQYLVLGEVAQLSGRLSYDPDGDALSYRWAFVSVPGDSALTSDAMTDRFTVSSSFTPDASGVYRVRLVVDDGRELGRDTATIQVD